MWATAQYLKLTHPYPILRRNSCEGSTDSGKNLRWRRWQQVANIYRKIYGIFFTVNEQDKTRKKLRSEQPQGNTKNKQYQNHYENGQ